MNAAQYIVDSLLKHGVTDAFGIPGGAILDLLYAFDDASPKFTPHLVYHEQDAGFAACGYAQACGRLGVAYATKGPGFTNLITAIAEAYYESVPVLFITAHSSDIVRGMRTIADQEMDTCAMVEKITKCAKRLDNADTFCADIEEVINLCLSGRKGPALLDVSSALWKQEVVPIEWRCDKDADFMELNYAEITRMIYDAKRPVLLVGDGIVQASAQDVFLELVSKMDIPVISSRATHYLIADDAHYMGYIGSHGIRYANFVLSKADLIIAIGNRMHYPLQSKSFGLALKDTKVLRFDIDASEFLRDVPNSTTYLIDAKELMEHLLEPQWKFGNHAEWNKVCCQIKAKLVDTDTDCPVPEIVSMLCTFPANSVVICDVGNHEFMLSRASVWANSKHRTIYSKSFGVLGNALGKAIGAYYATRQPVICFIGDQGLQMNSQELQYVSQHLLPIAIVIMNNEKSGMIFDHEMTRYGHAVHTDRNSGYALPIWEEIANAYGVGYCRWCDLEFDKPVMAELKYRSEQIPYLPLGNECPNMYPYLPISLYNQIRML